MKLPDLVNPDAILKRTENIIMLRKVMCNNLHIKNVKLVHLVLAQEKRSVQHMIINVSIVKKKDIFVGHKNVNSPRKPKPVMSKAIQSRLMKM